MHNFFQTPLLVSPIWRLEYGHTGKGMKIRW